MEELCCVLCWAAMGLDCGGVRFLVSRLSSLSFRPLFRLEMKSDLELGTKDENLLILRRNQE